MLFFKEIREGELNFQSLHATFFNKKKKNSPSNSSNMEPLYVRRSPKHTFHSFGDCCGERIRIQFGWEINKSNRWRSRLRAKLCPIVDGEPTTAPFVNFALAQFRRYEITSYYTSIGPDISAIYVAILLQRRKI